MTRLARILAPAAVAALTVVASAWSTSVSQAQDGADGDPRALVLDLVAQAPATSEDPAAVTVRIDGADAPVDAVLQARLYPPVATRAELWEAATDRPATPESSSWIVAPFGPDRPPDEGASVTVVVPRQPAPEADSQNGLSRPGPRPLHLELTGPDGAVLDTLRTFLLPEAAPGAAGAGAAITVAVVVDLRMPPSHRADGGAVLEPETRGRVLELAQVLTARPAQPVTVQVSPETLDALTLIGDVRAVSLLRASLDGRQLLTSPWTSLDLDDWIRAGRSDVVVDGLARGRETLRLLDLEPSSVMRFDDTPSAAAAALVASPPAEVTAFLADRALATPPAPVEAVVLLEDATGRNRPLAQADPLLELMLRNRDPELGVQWALAELLRMAAATDEPDAVIVVVAASSIDRRASDWADPDAVARQHLPATDSGSLASLLDRLDRHPMLTPASLDAVVAESEPVRTAADCCAATTADPAGFERYLTRRAEVETRLGAYESFVGLDGRDPAAAPLRTLLAVSASPALTSAERIEFLDAVDRQATQRTAGVQFVDRGRITITERSAALPVTVFSSRSETVTVTVALEAGGIVFPDGAHRVLTLQPGRSDLAIPIEVTSSGTVEIKVAITTPDDRGTILLGEGTLTVRRADASGLGLLVTLIAVGALAVWWLRASRRDSRSGRAGSATVATHGPASDTAL